MVVNVVTVTISFGQNFVCVWHSWAAVVQECRNLHFLSVCVCVCVCVWVHVLLFHASRTYTQKTRWLYRLMHRDACTDGRRVTITAAAPQPSCFSHCSSSCFALWGEHTDTSLHSQKLWGKATLLKLGLVDKAILILKVRVDYDKLWHV